MWRIVIIIAAGVLGAGTVLLTALPFLRSRQWWIRVWDFPRLQIAVIGATSIVAWLVASPPRSFWPAAGLAVIVLAVLYQLQRIRPYTPLASKQAAGVDAAPAGADVISILVSNVLMDNRNADLLLQLVDQHDPDVVLALETDDWWREQLEPIASRRPHVVLEPRANTYGMLLFSRFPLTETVVRSLTSEDVPSIRTGFRVASGRTIVLHALHPPPPFPGLADASTPRDAELVMVAREVEQESKPVIVAGDLNDVAWSDTTKMFQRISGLLDPRVGRGLYSTFHAKHPIMRWPLDHVFFSTDFTLVRLRRLPAIGSDHFPLLVTVALTANEERHEEPDPADEAVEDEAETVLEDLRARSG